MAAEPNRETARADLLMVCVGLLLAVALVLLLHDPNYASASGADSVEAGRDIGTKEVREYGVNAATVTRLIGVALLPGTALICMATLPTRIRIRWDALAILMFALLLWAYASWWWSAERHATVRELIRLTTYVCVGGALAARFDPRRLCIVLVLAIGGSALVSVVYEIATGGFTPWRAEYRLTGSLHSNAVATQATIAAIIAYAFGVRHAPRRTLWLSLFIVAVTVVVLTKTRTALGTIGVGMAISHFVGRPKRDLLLYGMSGAALLAAGAIAATVVEIPIDRELGSLVSLGRRGDDGTLTGRVPLWEFIWDELEGRRPQGVGYGAFWVQDRTMEANYELNWFPRQSHNGYVEITAGVGLVGAVLAVTIGFIACARSMALAARLKLPETCAIAAMFGAAFVNCVTETGFVTARDAGLVTSAMLFSLVLVAVPQSELVSRQEARALLPRSRFSPKSNSHPNL